MNNPNQEPTQINPEMKKLEECLRDLFPGLEIVKRGPASKSDDEKTDIVGKNGDSYIKGFTRRVLGETEYKIIKLFNEFSKKNDSNFSGPKISRKGNTPDGGYFFIMEDAKQGGKEELDLSKMSIEKIIKLYDEYRPIFDEFEKYSKGKTSTESNPKIQLLYSLYKRYLQPEVSSQPTTKISNIINGVKTVLGNTLQPAFKLTIGKKYKDKINERISNGRNTVENYGINIDTQEINTNLDKLLSKVKSFNFEYNFGRFWTGHVFSDGTEHKFVDFDNVSYQIKGAELIGIMRSNVLLGVDKYNSYDKWKKDYDTWYQKLLETYEDENLVKLLLFVKLVGTIFEDYGHLINEGNNEDKKIKNGIERNYRALQELMKSVR